MAGLTPYLPVRSKDVGIQDEHLIVQSGLTIPSVAGATPSIVLDDVSGSNLQHTQSDFALNISKGGAAGFNKYMPKVYNDATYQTLANLSTDLTPSATKYPSVNAVLAGITTPTLQQVTTAGATTTVNVQANRLTAGKTNGGEVIESNGAVSAFGSINAHGASRASLGWASSVAQIWSHGANSGTKGGFQFLSRSSDGSLTSTPFIFLANDNCGFGVSNPLAYIHIKAGAAAVSSAPIKFSTGTLQTTPENGTIEYDGTNFYATPSAVTRKTLAFLESPTFTGTPTLPTGTVAVTQTAGDNSTKIATTAYEKDAADRRTGWAQYVDTVYTSGSPLSVAAAATVTLTNNAGTSITSQLPTGVTDFYDQATSKITPQNVGDYYNITVRFKAKNTEAVGGYFDFGIDLGGGIGITFKESCLFVKGAATEQQFCISANAYVGATFLANGGIPKITGGNGTTTIYDIDLHVNRTHKAK